MPLTTKGLPQVSQDGRYLWFTDKTGEYDLTTNDTGWGAPNFERNESALLTFIYRITSPKELATVVSSAVAYSASFLNTDESSFQFDYLGDGYHQFNMVRIMASGDDKDSLDGTPVALQEGDIWYNTLDFQVKRMESGVPVVVDLTSITDLDIVLEDLGQNAVILLCETNYYKELSIKKNEKYAEMRQARREENNKQVQRLRTDQIDIILGTGTSAYQFSFGLKTEAQDTIETLLDDFKI